MSTTKCQRCGARSTLFLCRTDTEALADMLDGLPRWIGHLTEAALGQTRLGDPQRRHRGDEQPMRYNPKAATLLQRVHATLGAWIRHLCEARALTPPEIVSAPQRCQWLRTQVNAIAADETAAECYNEIEALIADIERRINRPSPPRFLGPCITDPAPEEVLTQRRTNGYHDTRCNRALSAERTATTVSCPQCQQTYDVDAVMEALFAQAGHSLMTVRELVDFVLPKLDEPVPERTLLRWIKQGWVEVRGVDVQGAQMVQLSDVRHVRAQRPRHTKAQALTNRTSVR